MRRPTHLYVNIAGRFYCLCSILDGFSRAVVHWEIREAMREADVKTILQRIRERHPGAKPRIISDDGPQFLVRDFKELVRIAGMTHVRKMVGAFVDDCNNRRLLSAVGFITTADTLQGRREEIWADRARKLEAAREARRLRRAA